MIDGPGLHAAHSHILPGESIHDRFFPRSDGVVDVTITQGVSTQHLTAIPHVTDGMGDHVRVHIQPGGTSIIDQLHKPT